MTTTCLRQISDYPKNPILSIAISEQPKRSNSCHTNGYRSIWLRTWIFLFPKTGGCCYL